MHRHHRCRTKGTHGVSVTTGQNGADGPCLGVLPAQQKRQNSHVSMLVPSSDVQLVCVWLIMASYQIVHLHSKAAGLIDNLADHADKCAIAAWLSAPLNNLAMNHIKVPQLHSIEPAQSRNAPVL